MVAEEVGHEIEVHAVLGGLGFTDGEEQEPGVQALGIDEERFGVSRSVRVVGVVHEAERGGPEDGQRPGVVAVDGDVADA